jgi:hypothetical protein
MDWLDRLLELIGEIMSILTRNGGPAQGFGQTTGTVTLRNDGTATTTTIKHYGASGGDRVDLSPMNAAAATLENTGAVYGTPSKGQIVITHPATTSTAVFKYSFEHVEVKVPNTNGIVVPPVIVPTDPPPVDPPPPPTSGLLGTQDFGIVLPGQTTVTVSWSGLLPTRTNTGYRGSLLPYSSITTNTSASIYRSGNMIYLKGTNPVLQGYNLEGCEVYPQAANWTIQDCLFDASVGRNIYIPTGYTVPVNGSILYCTFDGKKVNNNNHTEFFFCDPRIHQKAFQWNLMLNAPCDGWTFGGSCGLITKNFFQSFGWRPGAHPDIITFNAGYTNQQETIIAYNYMDQTDPSGAGTVASNATISIKDNTDLRSNYFIYRNLHKGASRQHQIDDSRSSKIEFSENARYVINGPPIYGSPGADASWDGPYGAHYGQIYSSTSDIMIHDEIEARTGGQAYELQGTDYPGNTVQSSQKVEKFASGRPDQVTINSISTAGAFSIGAVSGATSYQYRTSIAGTGEFGAWTTLTTSGSGPLTGSLTLISNAYNHVLIRAVNANGPGPVSRTYQVSSALVANQAPGFTANPAVSGTTQVGSTLTTTAGTSGGSPSPTIAYQWQVDADGTGATWADIVGATNSTYILTSGELGKRVRSKVRATNGIGTPGYSEAFSGATAIITAAAAVGTLTRRAIGTVGKSAVSVNGEALSTAPGIPAGTVAGDRLILSVSSAQADALDAMTGWSPLGSYTFFGQGGVALYVRTASGSDTAPTVRAASTRTGDAIVARIVGYFGGSGVVEPVVANSGLSPNGEKGFEFFSVAAGATSNGTGRTALYALGVQSGSTGTQTFTGSTPTGFTKIAEDQVTTSSYNTTLTLYEKTGVGAGNLIPAVPTWTPTTPTQVDKGGHGLILAY